MGIKVRMQSDDGFTLIELMIASVIFVVGLVAVLSGVMSMFGQQRYADYDAITSNYINFFLEDLQEGVGDSGNIVNVSTYASPFDPFPQLFTPGGGTVVIAELGPVNVEFRLLAEVVVTNPVEVAVDMTFTSREGRTIVKSGSKMISY